MPRRVLVWFWSGNAGGAQFALNLAQRLGKCCGAEHVTLSLRVDDPHVGIARARGLDVRAADVISDRRRPFASIIALAGARRVLADHVRDIDTVIVPMNFAAAAPLTGALSQRLVYCAHDPAPHPGDYAALAQRLTQNVLLRRADDVVALSEFSAAQLRRQTSAGKMHVASLNSVLEPRPSPARSDAPVRFLVWGRMLAYKGLPLLADALTRVSGRADWRLTLVGAGPALTPALQAQFVALGADVRSEVLAPADIGALLRDHDVVLAPYLEASQSGVVAEALQYGRPCVVTPAGALVEQIGAGAAGWMSQSFAAGDIAATLVHVLDHPTDRARKSAAAVALAGAAYNDDSWGWLCDNAV